MEKICSKCMITKRITEFHKRRASSDGLSYICKSCSNANSQKWRQKNPEANRIIKANWYQKNKDRADKKTAEYVRKNPEKVKMIKRRHLENNRDKYNERAKKWQRNNPHKVSAIAMKRHCAKMNRTPSWLTEQDLAKIESIYADAKHLTKTTGIPHEVDHIIPLQGDNISGLHVPSNLCVIPSKINRIKGNKYAI